MKQQELYGFRPFVPYPVLWVYFFGVAFMGEKEKLQWNPFEKLLLKNFFLLNILHDF